MWFRSSSAPRKTRHTIRAAHLSARRLLLEGLEDRRVMAFAPVVNYPVGSGPQQVIAADFNNDGRLDLATANRSDVNVSVLLGNSDGTFQAALNSPTGYLPKSVAVGDFDGDGKLDLATANLADVSILKGNGNGGFSTPTRIYLGSDPSSVAVGDFNGDGKLDLGVTTNNYYGGGCGYYACYAGYYVGYANVLLGNGSGSFSAPTANYLGHSYWTAAASADFNGDGKQDFAASSGHSIAVLPGASTGILGSPAYFGVGSNLSSFIAKDANGDGRADLVTSNFDANSVSVFLGNGLGSFAAPQSYPAGASPMAVAIADFNGDLKSDLIAANSYENTVSVLLATTSGGYTPPVTAATGANPIGIVAGNFNADGRADAATISSSGVSVLLNNANWPPQDAPSITISDALAVTEGHLGTVNANFTVSLSAQYSQPVSVVVTTQDGSAVGGSDYQSKAETLTFNPGETSKIISIAVIGDRIGENDENFSVRLTEPTNAFIAAASGQGTILDDEPTVSIDGYYSNVEGNSGTKAFTFTMSISNEYDIPVTIDYSTADLTPDEQYWYGPSATAGVDYVANSGTVTFPAHTTASQPITVLVNGDREGENEELFFVNLSNPQGASLSTAQALGNILNDEPYAWIDGYATTPEGDSGTTAMTFTVYLSNPYDIPVTFDYATADLTPDEQYWYGLSATAGIDYTAAMGTVTFAAGQTSQPITVMVSGDREAENDELFFVNLSNPQGATLNYRAQGLGNIANDEPYVWIDYYASRPEGNSGQSAMTFTLHLSRAYDLPVTVNYVTADGSAVAGSDYTATTGTVTIPANSATATFTVPINGDTLQENDEYFSVNLTGATNATLSSSTAAGYIIDDDTPPTIYIDDAWQYEGNSGTTSMTFTVWLSNPSGNAVSVNYATANGTAKTSDNDYVAKSGRVDFAPGETSKTITISIRGDTRKESDEYFLVKLSSPIGATLGDSQGQGTIANDDGGGRGNGKGNQKLSSTSVDAVFDDWMAATTKKRR